MKKVFKMFLYTDYQKEEKWLNLMSQNGWNLLDKKGFIYYFISDNITYIYKKDCFPVNKKSDFIKDYLELNSDNGVVLFLKKGNWYYFRRDINRGSYDLYSDNESKLIYLGRIRNYMITILTFLAIFFEITFDKISSPIFNLIYILVYITITLFICLNFIPVVKEIISIEKTLKSKID
ncbi:MAG: DUF2812 domain-containing protein [Coprobacillus cateniformis]|uniref:DUF2812 domain-containing protein n=1 Tax=Longibaculum muris TaxID=1796628 RepID=UPI003AB396E1|nr:DUF2812 domain-containing protein [Coprobacillus cateniformis]